MPTVVSNIQDWQADVNKAKATLHPDENDAVYVISVTRRKQGIVGGVISKVHLETAAKLIAGETHIEATPEEAQAWEAHQATRREAHFAALATKDTRVSMDMQPIADLVQALTAASRPVQPPVQAPLPAAKQVAKLPDHTGSRERPVNDPKENQ